MPINYCTITQAEQYSKCFDCLSSTEKQALKVRFMAETLKAVSGIDLTNINTRNSAAACFACFPDFRLESMEVAIWWGMALSAGADLPEDIDMNVFRRLISCVPCGEQKSNRAAYIYILCQLAQLTISDGDQVPCWVAREVYGRTNPLWLVFRQWLMTEAPSWFRGLYTSYGRGFAKWISNKPRVKNFVRNLMDRVVYRKLGVI